MAARTVTVTKLGVGSFAKVVGVAYGLVGLVAGILATIAVSAGAITSTTTFVHTLGISLWAFGWGVIIYPAIAFAFGWVEGAILAIILNFVFKESKGLQVELDG
jgi:hypothetical protein